MMSIILMLLVLVASFILLRGLVGFCENIVGTAPATNVVTVQHDRRITRAGKALERLLSKSPG